MIVAAILVSAVMQWNITIENSVHFMAIYRAAGAARDDDEIMGRSYPMSSLGTTFKGLSIEQLRTPGTALRFQIVRQEGTLTCTGRSAVNAASGDFTYALDQGFAANLERRGAGRPTERMQLEWLMADADVYGLIDVASESGFPTPNVGAINTAVIHGVSAEFLKGLRAAGIHPSSFDEAIAAVDHGVTPQFITAMQAYGFRRLTIEEAITLVDHGVTPHYLDGLGKLGYHVTSDQAVRLVDHGVTIAYIRQLRSSGYSNLSVDDLIRLVDHGVK